jgi:hypothetical protein
MNASSIKKEFIVFPNSNEAVAVFPSTKEKPEMLLQPLILCLTSLLFLFWVEQTV